MPLKRRGTGQDKSIDDPLKDAREFMEQPQDGEDSRFRLEAACADAISAIIRQVAHAK